MVDIVRVRKVIEEAELPEWVTERRAELFEDWAGAEAARVRSIVRDDRYDLFENGEALETARRAVHRAFRRNELGIWPYVEFVIASEAA